MSDTDAPVSEEIATFLESGVSTLVGTRDSQLRPAAMRAMGVWVSADRRTISINLPEATAARTIRNLRDNGRVAATFSRPRDHRSLQIKGRCIDIHPTPTPERERVDVYKVRFVDQLEIVGLARGTTGRVASWPGVTIVIAVEELFDQTPGPAAGRKLDAAR